MPYRVELSPHAQRQLEALPRQVRDRLVPRLRALRDDPRPPGVIKLAGRTDLYRIRIGQYRAIYSIEDDVLVIIVVSVGHRSMIYREL